MYVHVRFFLDLIWTSFKKYKINKNTKHRSFKYAPVCVHFENKIVQRFQRISMIQVIVIQTENINWKIQNIDDDENSDVKEKIKQSRRIRSASCFLFLCLEFILIQRKISLKL